MIIKHLALCGCMISGEVEKMCNWEKIREDFPILKEKIYGKDLIYLDNAVSLNFQLMYLLLILHFLPE